MQRKLYLFVLKGSLAGLRQNHSDRSGASENHQVRHNCGASGTCPEKTGVVFSPPILGMRILLDWDGLGPVPFPLHPTGLGEEEMVQFQLQV